MAQELYDGAVTSLSDPEADIEAAMEQVLQPGRFIPYNASFDFVQGLEEVAARLGIGARL